MIEFQPIEVPNIPDLIISQLLDKLRRGEIHPGEQLPSEQVMQQRLKVPKQQIKAAFKKMEVYRIVVTKPQSGTYLIDISRKILIGLLENVLNIAQEIEPLALLDARMALESKAVELAARHCSESEIDLLRQTNEEYRLGLNVDNFSLEDDLFFHQEIVRFSHNTILISLYSFVTLELIDFWRDLRFVNPTVALKRLEATYFEHEQILSCIQNRNARTAVAALEKHLNNVNALLDDAKLVRQPSPNGADPAGRAKVEKGADTDGGPTN